jgi:predicted Zn-dependent protease
VVNVGNRIKNAAERYYQNIGRSADLANYSWEFNLLQSNELNAWCMPGGKVAVYTGILPITKDDNGLAVVMGHEVSHALAGHGNERISQAMMAQYGGLTWRNNFKCTMGKYFPEGLSYRFTGCFIEIW